MKKDQLGDTSPDTRASIYPTRSFGRKSGACHPTREGQWSNGCHAPGEVRSTKSVPSRNRRMTMEEVCAASLLWKRGATTIEIAGMLWLTEAIVYNNLTEIKLLATDIRL